MSRKIELLAPGGDVEAIKAAIVAGANAVYCGLDTFNARNRASNLSFDDLTGILRLAHKYDCEVFLTLNVVILEQELPTMFKLLNKLVNSGIDGIIVQDLGMFNLVKKFFPTLDIHASTQLTTHNEGQLHFLKKIGASRVNLSRELNLGEIKSMTKLSHDLGMLTEVFVHGALCIAFSGQCYSSSVSVGNSGNRGRCSQACREEYEVTATGNKYPLNLKDNSAYFDLPELVEAGVDSLKIEGRIKGAHYVYTVVDTWRKGINEFIETGKLLPDESNLHKVFNRDFTNSFLRGNLTKDMFIDSPRDYSVQHAVNNAINKSSDTISVVQIQEAKDELYIDKNALGAELRDKIEHLSTAKLPLKIKFAGAIDSPLTITAIVGDDSETNGSNSDDAKTIIIKSESLLASSGKSELDEKTLSKRFKSFDNSEFTLNFCFDNYTTGLSIPFKELTTLKNQLAFLLNNSVEVVPNVDVPPLDKSHLNKSNKSSGNSLERSSDKKHSLSILIADEKDFHLCDLTDADVYFKIPESLKKNCNKHIDLLKANPRLIPWFPAVLIGKDYIESVRILEQVRPKRIVTNNTGIAYKAYEMGIEWVAGPLLNTTNSYALLTLKEELNCAGAFMSNEINRLQLRNIVRPDNFKLYYSIYHPILMMTSRQCFFQPTVGCKKPSIEDGCMLKCEKATTIKSVRGVKYSIDKQKGGYPSIYNDEQFLNLDIVRDLPDLFDEFFIDLTNIGSGETAVEDKAGLLKHFESLLQGEEQSASHLTEMVTLSTNAQYRQGL